MRGRKEEVPTKRQTVPAPSSGCLGAQGRLGHGQKRTLASLRGTTQGQRRESWGVLNVGEGSTTAGAQEFVGRGAEGTLEVSLQL